MSFAENLKNAMMVRGVTARDLMREIDVTQPRVSHYMTGIGIPKWYRAIDIADTLEVSLDWLFDRDYENEQLKENTPLYDLIEEFEDICGVNDEMVYGYLKMSPCTFARIKAQEDVTMKQIIKLADYFDTSLDFLAGRGKQSGISQEEIDEYTNY